MFWCKLNPVSELVRNVQYMIVCRGKGTLSLVTTYETCEVSVKLSSVILFKLNVILHYGESHGFTRENRNYDLNIATKYNTFSRSYNEKVSFLTGRIYINYSLNLLWVVENQTRPTQKGENRSFFRSQKRASFPSVASFYFCESTQTSQRNAEYPRIS